MNDIKLTKKQRDRLLSDIVNLREVKLPEAKERLAAAAANGDLSENSDFDSAKEEIKNINKDIENKEDLLNRSSLLTDEEYFIPEIRVGNRVKILVDGKEYEKTITVSSGVDFLDNISPNSILGKKLIGRDLMDKFTYKDIKGIEHQVTILDVI